MRIDPKISQIDAAFPRVAGLKAGTTAILCAATSSLGDQLLSAREEEILMRVS